MNEPHLIVPQVVEKELKEKFPAEDFLCKDILQWTTAIQNIIAHQHLLTVHDFEQEGSEELDTVILKALVKACKSHSQEAQEYLDELKLAVAWNRVDIAKSEIFNGDVEWKSCDLEEVMMDALVNDKPEFVKLFIDNGANIYDFLTYSRLQRLYCTVSPKCLLYSLLLKKHEENRLTLAGMSGQQHKEMIDTCPLFTLHEVSRVLKDFLHDACRGFYQEHKSGSKKKMGQEGVAAALAACKILREMSHLETEAEVVRRMKEAKYEQLAVGKHIQYERYKIL
ncbi:UNVERIFIED_CONTAM: Transient receptor putative cation channel subfamily M member 5 [Gekko kuhli]